MKIIYFFYLFAVINQVFFITAMNDESELELTTFDSEHSVGLTTIDRDDLTMPDTADRIKVNAMTLFMREFFGMSDATNSKHNNMIVEQIAKKLQKISDEDFHTLRNIDYSDRKKLTVEDHHDISRIMGRHISDILNKNCKKKAFEIKQEKSAFFNIFEMTITCNAALIFLLSSVYCASFISIGVKPPESPDTYYQYYQYGYQQQD